MPDPGQALVEGVRRRDAAAVALALAAGADPNAVHRGLALHVAAGTSSVQVVRELLAAGADLDAVDRLGRTAVFPAAQFGGAWMIRVLVAAGVEPGGEDAIDLTAAGVARDHTVIGALEEVGVRGPRRAPVDLARLLRTRKDVSLVGKDYREQAVSYGNLSDKVVRQCDLRGATLDGCNLKGARVLECRLDFARIVSPCLDAGTAFTDCSLRSAIIVRGSADGATFERCDLRGATLGSIRGAGVLVECDLRGADLTDLELDGWVVRACALSGARVSPRTVQGCRLEACDLSPESDGSDVRSGEAASQPLLRAALSPPSARPYRRADAAALEAVDAVIARMQTVSAAARALPGPSPTLRKLWAARASSSRVTTVTFDSTGTLLATAASDGAVAVWDALTGTRLAGRTVRAGSLGTVSLSFQHDPAVLDVTVTVSCMGDSEHETTAWSWCQGGVWPEQDPASSPDGAAGATKARSALSVRRERPGLQVCADGQVVTVVSHAHVSALWPGGRGARLALGAPDGEVGVYELSDTPNPGGLDRR